MNNDLDFSVFEGDNPHKLHNFLDQCTEGSWRLNPDTNKIDITGNFNCSGRGLGGLKGIPFGEVENFDCSKNEMTSLEGCPEKCSGFKCDGNKLKNLVGGPQEVKFSYDCSGNQLTSLEGSPKKVTYFRCNYNPLLRNFVGCPEEIEKIYAYDCGLTSLEGLPNSLKELDCDRNRISNFDFCPPQLKNLEISENQLTDLQGSPRSMDRLKCSENKITTLVGCPSEINYFSCWKNKLTDLVGAPKKLEYFDCDMNPLTSLEGCPEIITDTFKFCLPYTYLTTKLSFEDGIWPEPGNISKWVQILSRELSTEEMNLVLTHPDLKNMFDSSFWEEKVNREKGPALLNLAYLWDFEKFQETKKEIEQRLSPLQLKQIKALRSVSPYLRGFSK